MAQLEMAGIMKTEDGKQPTTMSLLQVALQNNAAIDVIERLAALQKEALQREAEIQFNEAMNAVQSELGRIAPDLNNPQTQSRYASYAALDRVVRPVYIKHGFSLSFDTADCPHAEHVRVVCYVSHRGGHTRRYQSPDMPADGKGAKGGAVMTLTHATGSAISYGKRYLLMLIFNIAIGEDDDGNGSNGKGVENLNERLDWIASCRNNEELRKQFEECYAVADKLGDKEAIKAFSIAKNKRYRELNPNVEKAPR